METRNETIENTGLEERLDNTEKKSWSQKLKDFGRNYAIDTSAKVACFAPFMASMEAYNGLDADQILSARVMSVVVDVGVARVYGKARDIVRDKVNADKSPIRSYLADTLTMIGVYSPVYAGILAVSGAEPEQIGAALVMGAGIAAVIARPFGKYVLEPMRKKFGYVRKSKKQDINSSE